MSLRERIRLEEQEGDSLLTRQKLPIKEAEVLGEEKDESEEEESTTPVS